MEKFLLTKQLEALTDGVPFRLANLANAAALLWQELTDINWAGFYILQGEKLILGPFQGKPACVRIAVGKGVCGTAVAENRTQRVPDVHHFPGHIACDGASRSEIVVPIHKNGKIWGVLDIDSPRTDRFTPEDQTMLEEFVRALESGLPAWNG